jgi:hypothetical protein
MFFENSFVFLTVIKKIDHVQKSYVLKNQKHNFLKLFPKMKFWDKTFFLIYKLEQLAIFFFNFSNLKN